MSRLTRLMVLGCLLLPGCKTVDQTAGDGTCEVHHIAMNRERVRVGYGLMDPSDVRVRALKENPHIASLNGGCVSREILGVQTSPMYAIKWVCPICESNYQGMIAQRSNPSAGFLAR